MAQVARARAHDDGDELGILATIAVDHVEGTAAHLGPLVAVLLDHTARGLHGGALGLLDLVVGLGVGVAAHSHGVGGVEQGVERLALAHEGGDGLVVHELAALHGVRGDEAVKRADGGQQDPVVFCRADGHQCVVVGLLRVFREKHQPAAVGGEHDVRMIAVDVDGGGDGAIGVGHDDGQAQARRDGQLLDHVGETLAGSSREGARTGSAGAHAGAHRGVFAFDGDELRVHAALGHVLGEVFDDGGLGGDGIGAHHVGRGLAVGLGHHLVAVGREYLLLGHQRTLPSAARASASETISKVPNLHSCTQMPQPLQWS